MDFLYQIAFFLAGLSAADWWTIAIVIFALGLLGDIGGKWADKQEQKEKKREQREKGFITPPKPDKPERPPGLYKRFDAWCRNNKKKAWGGAIVIWGFFLMMGGD